MTQLCGTYAQRLAQLGAYLKCEEVDEMRERTLELGDAHGAAVDARDLARNALNRAKDRERLIGKDAAAAVRAAKDNLAKAQEEVSKIEKEWSQLALKAAAAQAQQPEMALILEAGPLCSVQGRQRDQYETVRLLANALHLV